MTGQPLFDPGLQPERTELAWRRTTLALAIGAVVSFRLLPPVLGLWSIGVGIAGVLISSATWIMAARRSRRIRHTLLTSSGQLPGGAPMLVLTLVVTGSASLGLLYIAHR